MNVIPHKNKSDLAWVYDALLIVVLVVAAVLRLTGSDWGQLNIQHPDENFMTSVTSTIRPIHSLAEYFDTGNSSLNPAVVGYPAYVYGTLPIFIVRYLADVFGRMNQVTLFGRQLSAVADLGTIALLYFIVKRFYKGRVALLAALFSALTVMQIQQSHFFTTDNFSTFFMFLTLYVAALIATGRWAGLPKEPGEPQKSGSTPSRVTTWLRRLGKDPLTYLVIAFGISLGMAVASKLNAVAMAVVLPIALAIRYSKGRDASQDPGPQSNSILTRWHWAGFLENAFIFLVLGALFSILSFRTFQPYAFSGPGFLDVKFNPAWIQKVQEQLAQANPNTDLPWALQWARRSHLYSFQNLSTWGLGLPLAILAWSGFLWMGWRMLKGEWKQHLLLWSWTGIYFGWQSLQYNPTMRYQLPVYPLLAMMSAWMVFYWGKPADERIKKWNWRVILAGVIGAAVLAATAAYAFAFHQIYIRPETRMAASDWIYQNVPGPINVIVQTGSGNLYQQPLPFLYGAVIQANTPYQTSFTAHAEGKLSSILLPHVADTSASGVQTLQVILSTSPDPQPADVLASMVITANFGPTEDARGNPIILTPDLEVHLNEGSTFYLKVITSGGVISMAGASVANETDYDYPLPFRTSSYDAFGGIYAGGLNLQVYWDDNADKLIRFQNVLNQADYLFIPTNHQYGQITRLPERYPLTTEYYRQLIGCPLEKEIIWCYRVAKPGTFQGSLGFDLVAVFESYPTIGSLVINDQAAEEAFTFYDHPKVLIFKKNSSYASSTVASILRQVDYSQAVHLTPGQADSYKNLLLPADQLAVQQAGGTWSELFDRDELINRYPALGALLWYLVIFLLGLIVYPLVRLTFPGLADHGYPLARIIGLLLWAWLSWLAGSLGLTYSKGTIAGSLGLIAILGIWQGWRQRRELVLELRTRWRYFLMVEMIFLVFFLLDLLIRLGNPDLWHPSKGGERPMEFAYFNAILKSTSFPPYDPWYAGGYINYYYYGYVIVGTPVKFLGIQPSVAFNLILPTLFSCLAVAAFSVGWNILHASQGLDKEATPPARQWLDLRFVGGISTASAMVLIGNLGIIRLFYQGFQRVAAPMGVIEGANIFQHVWWGIKGFFMVLLGQHLPYGPGDWYWFASRIFPPSYNEFYEFPAFSFLWSDLHAHVIALMLTVLGIAWAISVLQYRDWGKNIARLLACLLMGSLIIGSLKPTNTWDYYTYVVFGVVVLGYALWRNSDSITIPLPLPTWGKRLLVAGGAITVFIGLSALLYSPFSSWFGQAYNSIELWKGPRTPISTYLTQWGVFLFLIVSWMAWETRQWLAETPVSALNKLRPYQDVILGTTFVIGLVLIGQQLWVMLPSQTPAWHGVTILWLAMPLAIWAAVLLFRPGISDVKRLILFMTGTGLLLTMMVEIIVVKGDIGRFNTVFKFGLQSWILLGISAGAAFTWILPALRQWLPGWRAFWTISATLLVSGAALFLVVGGSNKISDRMTPSAPHSLDSMAFMESSIYANYGVDMDLGEDYRAIVWMQENVQGSPVIVEAAAAGVQYQWHSRYSIYTGLPDVVGWEWHQVQQRVLQTSTVIARGREVDSFYATTDTTEALEFLKKYNARYIIVGQLEQAKYTPGAANGPIKMGAPNGLEKFELYDGLFWQEVYRDGKTVIYYVPVANEAIP